MVRFVGDVDKPSIDTTRKRVEAQSRIRFVDNAISRNVPSAEQRRVKDDIDFDIEIGG
jgi:hypothetical protein